MPSRHPKADPSTDALGTGMPDTAGAYALVIELTETIGLPIGRFGGMALEPGCYIYAGSARGPGGIRARVARHLKKGKARHWHVDHLTIEAKAIHPIVFTGGSECAIVTALTESGEFKLPIPGFGSTDCRTCRSHLLSAPNPDTALQALARLRQSLTDPVGA